MRSGEEWTDDGLSSDERVLSRLCRDQLAALKGLHYLHPEVIDFFGKWRELLFKQLSIKDCDNYISGQEPPQYVGRRYDGGPAMYGPKPPAKKPYKLYLLSLGDLGESKFTEVMDEEQWKVGYEKFLDTKRIDPVEPHIYMP